MTNIVEEATRRLEAAKNDREPQKQETTGNLSYRLGHAPDGRVFLEFAQEIKGLVMDPDGADEFGKAIRKEVKKARATAAKSKPPAPEKPEPTNRDGSKRYLADQPVLVETERGSKQVGSVNEYETDGALVSVRIGGEDRVCPVEKLSHPDQDTKLPTKDETPTTH